MSRIATGGMTNILFVYGTLMGTVTGAYGRSMRERLHRECRSLGAATMQGRLYDLGEYPGLADSSGAEDRVHGEALLLHDPDDLFRWLDPYEGIGGTEGHRGEYIRDVRPVRLASGDDRAAWVYLCSADVSSARHIASGLWLPQR